MADASSSRPPDRGGGILQPILAGVLAAVVGYASSFTLVLAGLVALGASPAQAGSGLLAICLASGSLNILVAWRTKLPNSYAWSTPGAAFLATLALPEGGFAAAVGAFFVTGALIVLTGLWKPFARAVAAIPAPIANGMLAGMLLTLCLAPFKAIEAMPALALPVVFAWAIGLRFFRRYAVPLAVVVTGIILAATAHVAPASLAGAWPTLTPIMPSFTLDALVKIALPLFIVTMASQNLPGLAVMQANGYRINPAPQFIVTGLAGMGAALFGGHAINLAAITAAITAGPESHPDPARRWIAPVAAGFTYLALAPAANLAAAFIAASPPILIQAVAGLALFSSLASALAGAMRDENDRFPAIITFVVTASGIVVLGVGAAFWGIVAGLALHALLRAGPVRKASGAPK